ncbi:MAG TPA: hypothetical protein VFQ53_26380 [Kofleriaceae bacterium]|nr:hypothetical protein [Kofleriaceae bacterium]
MATQGPPNPPGSDPAQLAAGHRYDPSPGAAPAVEVMLRAPDPRPLVDDQAVPLWIAIRNRRTGYNAYADFVSRAFGFDRNPNPQVPPLRPTPPDLVNQLRPFMNPPYRTGNSDEKCLQSGWFSHGLHAYELLKTATEVFLLLECGLFVAQYGSGVTAEIPGAETSRVRGDASLGNLQSRLIDYLGGSMGPHRLPYVTAVIRANVDETSAYEQLPFGDGLLAARAECPCFLELIWSYWHEEGMLVQGLNALSMRFQNRRIGDGRDPLAQLELSPLRPLSSIFWGYIQDEQHRLSMMQRNREYEHEYGIGLRGKAVPANMRVADRRSKFIEAFHDLLFRCAQYYQQAANLQFTPDPFPLLNGLKEVHLILSQGAGNQFGDLPWTARVEMLMQQWILARHEIREFLGRRPMVSFPEAWMGNAESLKTVMGWTDTSILHFHDLAVFGEQLLLSIRWYAWRLESDPQVARNWAHYFRPEIQGYMHAYRVATGVDLTLEPKDSSASAERKESPSLLLERRLRDQRRENGGR